LAALLERHAEYADKGITATRALRPLRRQHYGDRIRIPQLQIALDCALSLSRAVAGIANCGGGRGAVAPRMLIGRDKKARQR
jgi:hypothetical protein